MAMVSASILSADFAALAADCTDMLAAGADWLHIDVMDGHFVPNISLGVPVLHSLHAALPQAYYDVHLMISDPAKYLENFTAAGARGVTFHLEAMENAQQAASLIDAIHASGCDAGISLRPGTPVSAVYPYLDKLELVLLMSVEPGFGGQPFMRQTPARIAELYAQCQRCDLHPHIEVDGGINCDTARLCTEAGADVLVMGSALFGAKARRETIACIEKL